MPSFGPAYIVPLLVEQPTWGGSYIAQAKSLHHPLVQGKNIGQSFELFSGTLLTDTFSSTFASAIAPNFTDFKLAHPAQAVYALQDLIDQSPQEILGKKAVDRGWETMQVLIKFTQAQNNSYQVHVRPSATFGQWLPKPESWYYLENGKATLGLADVTQVEAYKQRCLEIDHTAHQLSDRVKAGSLSVQDARQELKAFIETAHPRRFVHTIAVEKGAVIDLSKGGTHHSWELDPDLPNGNIVYEVQVDVMDNLCTLRSFDQGNLKDDGSVRPLTIEEYFTALDLSPDSNDPQHFLHQAQPVADQGAEITQLFAHHYYSTELVHFGFKYQGKYTTTQDSFHHLYALAGDMVVTTEDSSFTLAQGWSLFIPAKIQNYTLHSSAVDTQVLITHL